MGEFLIWFFGIIIFIIVASKFSSNELEKRKQELKTVALQLGFNVNKERMGYIEIPPQDLIESFKKLPMGQKV